MTFLLRRIPQQRQGFMTRVSSPLLRWRIGRTPACERHHRSMPVRRARTVSTRDWHSACLELVSEQRKRRPAPPRSSTAHISRAHVRAYLPVGDRLMQAQSRKAVMPSPKHASATLRRGGNRLAMVAFGCLLLQAGAAMGRPVDASDDMAQRGGGRITFSGAVVVATCTVPTTADAGGMAAFSSGRGQCPQGGDESRATYRASTEEIASRSGVPLLQYAKDSYRDAVLVTYTYE